MKKTMFLILLVLILLASSLPAGIVCKVAGGYSHSAGVRPDGTVITAGSGTDGQCDTGSWRNVVQVATRYCHTVGLRADGTVVAAGYNVDGRCDTGGWTQIIQVAAGQVHTVGLKADGTVLAIGGNEWGQCDVSGWSNIVQVAAGWWHTVGLKADGTVVVVGNDEYGQIHTESWLDIIQVAAGGYHTVGLKADGTLLAVGENSSFQCNVSSWTEIVQVAAGWTTTIGLKADGTVLAIGYNIDGRCDVSGWSNVAQVAAGLTHTLGLRADGFMLAAGDNTQQQCEVGGWILGRPSLACGAYHSIGLQRDGAVRAAGADLDCGQCNTGSWNNVTRVAGGWRHTAGLRADGTVAATGWNADGQCNTGSWSGVAGVSACGIHTVGRKADGTAVATGGNAAGQCDVSGWSNIVQVAAGELHTVGLLADGTAVAAGDNTDGQCNVGSWSQVVQLGGGYHHTVARKADGTAVATGWNTHGECDVNGWTGLAQVAGGYYHTAGLKADGTLLVTGDNSYGQCDVAGWSNVIWIAAGMYHTLGLKADGTVLFTGRTSEGQDASSWHLAVFPPVVDSPASSGVTPVSAFLGGTLTGTGHVAVTERGIFWSTTGGFTPPGEGVKASETGGWTIPESFSLNVTGLPAGSTVYFRAFATNSNGTGWTAQASFATPAATCTISGTITRDGAGLPGVQLSGLPGDPVTDGAGFYQTTVDWDWSGTVTPVLAGHSFDPIQTGYSNITLNQTGQDYLATRLTIPAAERTALIAFYNATGGDGWTDNAGWKAPPLAGDGFAEPGTEGGWSGVTVSNYQVTELNLANNNLAGSLPVSLGDLSNLRRLDLNNNQLTGVIPSQIGDLEFLELLSLWRNLLSGGIPDNLGNLTRLNRLFLSENQLTGPIPTTIGNLVQLKEILLRGNLLTGEIPSALGQLTGLFRLHLDRNLLTGSIPVSLSLLLNMEDLDLGTNQLTGEIPVELGNLNKLIVLSLGGNRLTGSIPASFSNLFLLKYLNLQSNQLTGGIPPEIGNMTALVSLDMGWNQLSGPVPVEIGNLLALTWLGLCYNSLSGEIPVGLGNLSKLEIVDLSNNQLSGAIPASLGNLCNLRRLDLNNNQLTGVIPAQVGDLIRLEVLSLWQNFLSGPVPGSLGNLTQLRSLYLHENQLTGPIPSTFGNLMQLEELLLRGNRLTGEIPSWLGQMTKLLRLFLDRNQFNGTIPASLGLLVDLVVLDLSTNQLTGEISVELGNLNKLIVLSLGGNRLTGSIPASFGNLALLQYLALEGNQLTGPVPPQSGNLLQLRRLLLAGNMLSGELPAALANLENLEPGQSTLGHNAYYTPDPRLAALLSQASPGWDTTQTLTPTGISASTLDHQSIRVEWTPIVYQGDSGGYRVFVADASGGPFREAGITASKSESSFIVNGLQPGRDYWFQVRAETFPHGANPNTVISAMSAEAFARTAPPPSLAITSPDGGEVLPGGTSQEITWRWTGVIGDVRLEYSTDDGASWTEIVTQTENDGNFDWLVPDLYSTRCRVRVTDPASGVASVSSGSFSIHPGGWSPAEGLQYNMIVLGTAYLGDVPAATGDLIGAFGPAGSSDCRALATIGEGGAYYLTVRGDATAAEMITFRLFPRPAGPQLEAGETIPFLADGVYANLPLHFGIRSQTVSLTGGWNWTSFLTLPDDPSLGAVFAPLSGRVEQVKSQTAAAVYHDGSWIGDLQGLAGIGEGIMYKIKTNQPGTLTVAGETISYNQPLDLITGWNWTAYLPWAPLPLTGAVASIFPYLTQVKSQTQSAVKIGDVMTGDLTQMVPGRGYTIKMTGPGTLIYPRPEPGPPLKSKPAHASRPGASGTPLPAGLPWTVITGNQYNMVAFGKVYRDNGPLAAAGYYVASFGPGGSQDCRSLGPVRPDGSYFATIRGDSNGETITFKLYDSAGGALYDTGEAVLFQSDDLRPAFDLHAVSLRVQSPDGGERWLLGSTRLLRWHSCGISNLRIELFKDGSFHSLLTASTPAAPGSLNWDIPAGLPPGDDYRIRLIKTGSGGALNDMSDADFSLVAACTPPPATVLTAPVLAASGSDYTISWTATSPDQAYQLAEAQEPGFSGASVLEVTGTCLVFNHTVAQPDYFYYRVRACYDCDGIRYYSPWSAIRHTCVGESALDPADLDGDGDVDQGDLQLLARHLAGSINLGGRGDLNGDGPVNALDLNYLLGFAGRRFKN